MKKISNFLAALVFVSLVIFISCTKDSGTPEVDPQQNQSELMVGTWTVNANLVVYEEGNPDVSWDGMTLTISNVAEGTGGIWGGNYATSNVPTDFGAVWPGNGTWAFADDTTIDDVVRNDGVTIEVATASATSLRLEFDIPDTGGRTSGIAGSWDMTFTKQ